MSKHPRAITKTKEHFIPVMLLKRFCVGFPYRPGLFLYNRKTGEEKIVSVRDICHSKYLYEMRKNGNILYKNLIENVFSSLENEWNKVLRKIENNISLEERDIVLLKLLITLQLLRLPGAIRLYEDTIIKNINGDKAKDEVVKLLSRKVLFADAFAGDERDTPLWNLFELVARKQKTIIYHTKQSLLLGGEWPVFGYNIKCGEPTSIYLPVSSHICVGLIRDVTFEHPDEVNLLTENYAATKSMVNEFNFRTCNSNNFIIGSEPIKLRFAFLFSRIDFHPLWLRSGRQRQLLLNYKHKNEKER